MSNTYQGSNPNQNPYYINEGYYNPGGQNINPYMTENLYGLNQSNVGTRANSVFNNTLTSFGQNQVLQYEEILPVNFQATTFDVANNLYSGTATVSFTDQQKIEPPECLIFVRGSADDTGFKQTVPYFEFDPIFQTSPGSLQITGVVTGIARTDAVVLTAKSSVQNFYYFTVYVLANNTLSI